MKRCLSFALMFLIATSASAAAERLLTSRLPADQLDPAVFAEWVDGAEHAIQPADTKDNGHQAQWITWTDKGTPGHAGLTFGASPSPGPRHLRVGLKSPAPIGAVLVRGGVRVSVLKPDAAYPGNLADESQWIAAERIKDGKSSADEATRDSYVLWTLPATTATRAIRFTHVADVTAKEYAGWLGAAAVVPVRVANLATMAMPAVSANQKYAGKLANENVDPTWEQWANLALKGGDRAAAVSPTDPEWAMLTWPTPVKLRGLATVFAGFAEAEAQAYAGPDNVHPREAPESAWKTVAMFTGLHSGYPVSLPADWLDFGQDVTTRAIRLRITKPLANGGHPHTQDHPRGGKRVWLGELLALSQLPDNTQLKSVIVRKSEVQEQPPIPVKFTLPEAGWVTLVIEDAAGTRVRNLIADTFFEKGEHTIGWDGSDDLGRDPSAAQHGLYYIPTRFVEPGNYRVRGLWRKQVDVRYEMGVYSAGSVPWETADRTGGWLSNHTPPSAVLFVPDVPVPPVPSPGERSSQGPSAGKGTGGTGRPSILIGSYVSEGTAGLAWVDLDGKKFRGQGWVGGNWTGAPHLARDAGPKRIPDIYAYAASAWSVGDGKTKPAKGEIRITGLTAKEDRPILKYEFTPRPDAPSVRWEDQIGGIAAYNGIVVVSLPTNGQIIVVDVAARKVLHTILAESPRGLAFDAGGQLIALSKNAIGRFSGDLSVARVREVLAEGLDDPTGLALDGDGNVFVSERGNSHQVKVYGKIKPVQDGPNTFIVQAGLTPIRTIGKPGAPAAGPYDPLHLNNPRGLTIDSQNRLWVAEEDNQPKRVSVWSTDGKLLKSFYGPVEYGGGGSVDPSDKTKFYYNGMEFRLDWEKGTNDVASIFYRPGADDLKLPFRDGVPQNAIYAGGRRYWTNAYNSNPTGGHGTAFIFADRNGIAVPCAGFGRANEWEAIKGPEFAAAWPAGTDPKANAHADKAAVFLWQDRNADGHVQADELTLQRGTCGGVVVQSDLSFVVARLGGKAVRIAPSGFTPQNVPTYDFAAAKTLVDGTNTPPSSGGDQALVGPDGWTIHTNAPKPFSAAGIGGARDGVPLWSYPSLWPGLHASHEAPVPDRAGEIIGHTRLLGDIVRPGGANGEPMFFLNGNTGCVYVFTCDGLFVAQLMQDMRVGRPWMMPAAQRGMVLNDVTPSDENFWPNVSQTADGKIYLVAGRPSAIARVDGLETVKRIAATELNITPADLDKAREYFVRAEAARQAAQGRGVLTVAIRKTPPMVDGKADEWTSADWAEIDKRGSRAYFNSKAEAYDVTGAVAIAGDRLYAVWRTGDKDLLKNAGDVPKAPFKTGGALDLMIGTSDASASDKRSAPVPGDMRLLITQVNGKTRALLYRPAVTAGEAKQPVPFSSPGRTITFDRVDDVSDQVQLAAGGDGTFEVSVPLSVIGVNAAPARSIRGDIGILRGTGSTTTQRVYWSNKATAIVADVPSEAELRPGLWGRWEFRDR